MHTEFGQNVLLCKHMAPGTVILAVELIWIQQRLAIIQQKCRGENRWWIKKKNLVHVYCCNCVCHCGVHIVSQLKVKETGESAASNHMKAFFNILYPWCTSCCGNCKIEAELGITSILYSVVLVPPETTAHVLAESYMVLLKKQHQPTEVHIKTETTQRKGTKGMMKTWSSLLHGYMCTYILGQESIT